MPRCFSYRRGGAPSEAPAQAPLAAAFARITTASGGTLGVSAVHIESGERAGLRGGETFPMMSVCKLPIALALLHQVEGGMLSLGKRIAIGPSDMRLGNSPLSDRYPEGGATRTLDALDGGGIRDHWTPPPKTAKP